MSAEEFCSAHGKAFVTWLQKNTEECKCKEKYANDETKQTSGAIDVETEILCRRCFVPVGLKDVRPREPAAPLPPWPCIPAAARRHLQSPGAAAATSSPLSRAFPEPRVPRAARPLSRAFLGQRAFPEPRVP